MVDPVGPQATPHAPSLRVPLKRYTKQRGTLLWTTGTTRNTEFFIKSSGVLLLRRMVCFYSGVDNIDPLIVHACHCYQCQRITGSAFVMNAVIEKSEVEFLSGTSHTASFCPNCGTYVCSQYVAGRLAPCWFIWVGTLDEPDRHPPGVHIYTSSKQPWVVIPQEAPRFEEFYGISDVWRKSSLARMEPYWQGDPNR